MPLREALAPPSVVVGGGPFAAKFSGIVRGMSRKIRGGFNCSIVKTNDYMTLHVWQC